MTSPSRMRKLPSGPTLASSVPAAPMIPIEVLLIVSSLSCCSVSRSACRPWRMSSSSVPAARSQPARGEGETRGREHSQSMKLS